GAHFPNTARMHCAYCLEYKRYVPPSKQGQIKKKEIVSSPTCCLADDLRLL
ncbi:Hypothetical protein FKW44_011416, partial [Caligus rogercresseyi]